VETRALTMAGIVRVRLQWGHAFVSVETRSAAVARTADGSCFNGATLL